MVISTSRSWVLASKPVGYPTLSGPEATFRLEQHQIEPLRENEVLLRTLYLSNDPAQRQWIDPSADPARLYVKPVEVGETMPCVGSICEVVSTTSPDLPEGSRVFTMGSWSDFTVQPAAACRKIEVDNGQSMTLHLGMFGPAGVTAYYGLVDIGQVTSEDTLIVSGAAGAVGAAAVQIAKQIIGCKRVIGIAGDDAKCRWVESLGADTCLNYKSDTFQEDLKEATRGFVNVIYDNVGGKILDLMLARVAKSGRLLACGLIAGYNHPEQGVVKNWYQIIAMRVKVLGFVVLDLDADRWEEIIVRLGEAVTEGKLKADASGETILPTRFEDIPQTWMKLFSGTARGKLISKIEA